MDHLKWGRESRGLPTNWPKTEDGTPESPEVLTTLSEQGVCDVTVSMLNAYGIPVMKDYESAGTFARVMFGGSGYGVRLLVPQSKLEEAQAILEAEPQLNDADFEGLDD